MPTIEAKRKAVNERIGSLERAIRIAREYLESGMHAAWLGFRPLFGRGANLPPHKDWVKNVFLRRREKALAEAEKLLQRLDDQERDRVRGNHARSSSSGGWHARGVSGAMSTPRD
ncbi:hypothetical protein [Humisphaera borealis]|uniref:Uncharacterized protein n=1 Tax=Humisphaera borealis TaxID=2807512 RepID=A0A7M2X0G5_9BACT|nr:hypothetical protein [Humisphaera borealis]QOV91267.1 hypothetical protein IPV69_07885 [Humisphaera borealis]